MVRATILSQMMTVSQALALALQHHQAGQLAQAEALYRQILSVQPRTPDAWNNLGGLLAGQNRFAEAEAAYRQAIQLKPDYAEAVNNLGEAYRSMGRVDEAITAYRRALEIAPHHPEIQKNLGLALAARGRFDEAIAAFERALSLRPDDAIAHCHLGALLVKRGNLEKGFVSLRRAIQLDPACAEACYHLGNALSARGRFADAVVCYRRALQLKTDYAEAWNNMGNALKDLGRLDEAASAFQSALRLQPDLAEAHMNLSNVLKDQGRLDEAIAELRHAVLLKPDYPAAHSNLIYALLFHSENRALMADALQRWSENLVEPLKSTLRPHNNERDPERRLRIGYVSPNFQRHPICHFLAPLLAAHDKARFEIFCYASVRHTDEFTTRLQKNTDVWRDVLKRDDGELAEQIRADQIDILVDLTQHMADYRLLLFARKPAPVQVAWLGYPATTGLPTMDYRLTDAWLEPENAAWSDSVEKPIRLPDSWFCFDPIESPEPSAPPAGQAGYVTFGSLNNFCKVNEAVLRLWATVLEAVEGSRLLLYCPTGSAQTRVRQWFAARGIPAERLELVTQTGTRLEYLGLFRRIDIALDPFPYGGGTTTCEALWMGVPVVSLAGKSAVSRLSLSVLTTAGLPELVAASEDDYVRIAMQLANDLPRLAELRTNLRPRMQASPLMDAPRFARNIETAYRTMWRQWCGQQPSR